jgi:hypothetical protein
VLHEAMQIEQHLQAQDLEIERLLNAVGPAAAATTT